MANRAVEELRAIPFGYLIGAPLRATVEAQALAAQTTIDFISKVGFKREDPDKDVFFGTNGEEIAQPSFGEARTITFQYTKIDEDGATGKASLTVPVLSVVPIPSLRVDEVTIDFTAKLNDTIQSSTSSTTKIDASLAVKYSSFWSPVKVDFRTSMSYESAKTSSARYSRDYTMNIHVRAVQDDIPAGLSRMLDILEATIREKPVAADDN